MKKMILPVSSAGYAANNNQNTSFKGGRLNVLTYALNGKKRVNTQSLRDFLNITKEEVQAEVAKGINNPIPNVNSPLKRHKAGFLFRLAKEFRNEVFGKTGVDVSAKRQLVYDIYDKVKYPSAIEKRLVSQNNYSLEQLDKLFDMTNQNPYLLKFSEKLSELYSRKFYGSMPYDLLMTFLTNPEAKGLNKNFNKFSKQIEKAMKTYYENIGNIQK